MRLVAWTLGILFAAPVFGAGCASIIGDWKWVSGGVTTFTASHNVIYDGKPFGTWTCLDSARDVLALKWANGFVDTLTISGDHVAGKNQVGMAVSGTRASATKAPKDAAAPAPARTSGASPVQATVVTASGALQACLGINLTAGTFTGDKPATKSYCRQLPGWELYDQAGEHFKAGDKAGSAAILTRSAEAGNALAQLRLAMMYEAGTGVQRSARIASSWYARAAAAGEPASQMELGGYFEEGDGVPENWDYAAKLYHASAMQGWHKGQSAFGRCYQFGIGVPQDRQQAITWFEKAAAQGNAQAKFFATHLRQGNNIGFRNDMEHDLVIGGKLRFGLGQGDPAGIAFHSSAQRIMWLQGERNAADRSEAEVFRQIRRREYDDCKRAGRDNCIQ